MAALAIASCCGACGSTSPGEARPTIPEADRASAAETITAADMHRRIGVLAHDSMAGRATPSPELDAAAQWIASELQAMGLEGGAEDGGFIQRYSLNSGPDGDQAVNEGPSDATGPTAPNVVAVLEGRDSTLANEYVVFSAHMDHIGTGAPDEDGDSIFNGADDDASGTSAVLEVAEAMTRLDMRPRRSMIFLLVSGEEGGLWGSRWYAGHPTVPLDAMVAALNADMVGRNWPDTIAAIGDEHSDLGPTVRRVAARHPELGLTVVGDLWPQERFYFRSDHYNFARAGVPVLFFFNGTHVDYHGRNDEPDRIDAEKAARVARLLFYLGLEISEADERPQWVRSSYRQIVG